MTREKKNHIRPRTLLLVLAAMVLLGAGAYHGVLALLPWAVISAPNAKRDSREVTASTDPQELGRLGVKQEILVQVGPPAASISCWILEPDGPQPPAGQSASRPSGVDQRHVDGKERSARPRGTVLLLHGIRDSKRSLPGLGRALARDGLRIVLVDLRGHGQSTGRYLTYGAVESRDLVRLLDQLEAVNLLIRPAGVMGLSYGAAVAIQHAGRDSRVSAVVAVASFSSLRQVLMPYVRHHVPLLGRVFGQAQIGSALARAGEIAAFDPDQASPLRAIARTRAPVLLLHGTADRRIPLEQARALRAAAPAGSRLIQLTGADHGRTVSDPTGRVREEARAWFARHLGLGRPSGAD